MNFKIDMVILKEVAKSFMGDGYSCLPSPDDIGKLRIKRVLRHIGAITLDEQGMVRILEGSHLGQSEMRLFQSMAQYLREKGVVVDYHPSYGSD